MGNKSSKDRGEDTGGINASDACARIATAVSLGDLNKFNAAWAEVLNTKFTLNSG